VVGVSDKYEGGWVFFENIIKKKKKGVLFFCCTG